MKIKSDFRDYYDAVQKEGQNQEFVYLRYEQKTVSPGISSLLRNYINYHNSAFYKKTHAIIFCGKLYHVLEIFNASGTEKAICYSFDDVDKFVEEHTKPKEYELWANPVRRYRDSNKFSNLKREIQNFYQSSEKDIKSSVTKKYLDQVKAPIVLIYNRKNPLNEQEHVTIENARINHLEFFRIFDAYSAYQEISMWLGNQASPEKEIPKLDDKTMSEIKGFDKWSFRKESKKK